MVLLFNLFHNEGQAGPAFLLLFPLLVAGPRLGDEERRLKHLVPAPLEDP